MRHPADLQHHLAGTKPAAALVHLEQPLALGAWRHGDVRTGRRHAVSFQAEYRGGLDINPFDAWDRDAWHGRRDRDWGDWEDFWWEGPQVVLFADAGTGWLKGSDPGRLHWDIGAGLEVGSVGLYAARAIERNQPIRWTLRIHRRF